MTATTDIVTTPRETRPGPTDRAGELPPARRRRASLAWIVVILAGLAVAALAVVTFTGDDDSVEVPAIPFNPEADRIERQAHLDGAAQTYGSDGLTSGEAPVMPFNPEADRSEREARLEGAAETYGGD